MSLLSVVPAAVAAASGSLQNLGDAVRSANATAASQTTAFAAPAADEVSAAVTAFFGTHAEQFQSVSAKAAAFHDQFVGLLNGGAARYLSTEIANAQQTLAGAANAAANPAATSTSTEGISTPFGPISVTTTATFPDSGTGPLSFSVQATTPIGPAGFSLSGNMATTTLPPPPLPPVSASSILQFTGGTLTVPTPLQLLLATAGPAVTGGTSVVNSVNAFTTAVRSGNVLGAVSAYASAPANFTNAVLFGQQSVAIPFGDLQTSSGDGGPTVTLHVPFSGVFAGPQPISVSWPSYSYTDYSLPLSSNATVLAGNIALQGSQFGGIANELLNAIGLVP